MEPRQTLSELRRVQNKYENVVTPTFQIVISDMARDAANTIEQLLTIIDNYGWISVHTRLPKKPKYDWVLVQTKMLPEGTFGMPHIAELRYGVWYSTCCEGPMEETLSVEVDSWFDPELLNESNENIWTKKKNILAMKQPPSMEKEVLLKIEDESFF